MHHGGGGPGARAEFARFVDDRLSIIVLMNLDDVDPDSIVYGVAALYLPPPAQSRPRNDSRAELLRRVFALDVLECANCCGRMRILAAI